MKTKICSSLILTLLFAQKVYGDCVYDKYLRHCSCSLLEKKNIMSILPCAAASSFEFNRGTFINTEDFSALGMVLEDVSLTKISFVNVVMSEDFLAAFIIVIWKVPIDLLSFENTTFVGQSAGFPLSESPPLILSLQFINVSSNPLIQRDSAFYRFGNWMSSLENLTVKESQLREVPCDMTLLFQSLSTLDLSENLFLDDRISSMFCKGAYPNLTTLKLRRSNFSNYETLCQAVRSYNQLRYLDLSLNDFSKTSNSLCEWQSSLSHLNLSNTGLEEVGISLPPNCEVLDISHNRIEFLNISLPKLRELYLSFTRLSTLSSMGHMPLLQILAVDGNPIKSLQVSQIQTFKNLRSFKGDNIPYTCSCSFIKEMKAISISDLTVEGWPDGYVCDSPETFNGKLINDVNHSLFDCHTQLLTGVICIVILILCVSVVICFVKICRSSKARSQCMDAGNTNNL